MKLIKIFETQIIPETEKTLKKEEDLLFQLETIKAIHGDKNGLQAIISKQQQSIYTIKLRLKECQFLIKRLKNG